VRPQILFPLFAPVTTLPGVGPRLGKLVEKLTGDKVVSLCWHLPTGLVDRRPCASLAEAPADRVVTVTVIVDGMSSDPKQPKVRCRGDRVPPSGLLQSHADYQPDAAGWWTRLSAG
jgi:ATP-dependent DNA helicase RecG